MRGLLNGDWEEIEEFEEASRWLPEAQYTVVGDPERGTFGEGEFEAIEA